ncbi:39S ribosomal protein L19, mitochondrial [Pararge aegeria]|uniref:Large ribosomal subunit protein bL19m n=1 Tax=Pararge aegeria aegeria TaxID=348720 RepID=A0A8S4QJW1_9NEOP|nr:39S ribosomal protein L19, mitochondrial [Pararge aegeria]CAH2210999.1 jg14931 [Pararge aegeria aegeria]
MSVIRKSSLDILSVGKWILRRDCRLLSAVPEKVEVAEKAQEEIEKLSGRKRRFNNPVLEYRHVYPEFLPDPNPKWRNSLREKMERADMLKRRSQIDIPEFYVGSILAVTISDPHAQGKTNRFVGICIERKGCGLRAEFILRNVVDHQGVEVKYELYDPTIQSIQVLRLEKRLDDKLYYLRDALPEYCTFPQDMDPEMLPEGTPVPLNPVQVKLKPKPWLERWERQDLKGVSNIEEHLKEKDRVRRELRKTPWEKYDLMKQYRKTIPAEDQTEIWSEVYNQLQQMRVSRKKLSRKRLFTTPKPQLG